MQFVTAVPPAAIYQSLKDEETLPSDIKLFIATTKCKEGINIMDKDIKIMLSENHYYIDLIQMAGRVRNGLNTLYVIYDARQNYDSFSRFDAEVNRECGIYGNRVAGMSLPVKSLAPALEHVDISCRKTGRNSDGKRIIEYIPPDDGIEIEL